MRNGAWPARFQRRHQRRPALQIIIQLVALSASFSVLSADAKPLPQRLQPPHVLTLIAGERWLPATEESWITLHLAMPEKFSIREQYLNQEVLAALLRYGAGRAPSARSCEWSVRRGDVFGDFSIRVSHPNLARRLECLRSAADYLLKQTIDEADFRLTPKDEAYWALYGWPAHIYAQPLALLKIYEKYSPLYQIHSVGPKDFPTFRLMNLICGCASAVNES
jgi:hypothetical protein